MKDEINRAILLERLKNAIKDGKITFPNKVELVEEIIKYQRERPVIPDKPLDHSDIGIF